MRVQTYRLVRINTLGMYNGLGIYTRLICGCSQCENEGFKGSTGVEE